MSFILRLDYAMLNQEMTIQTILFDSSIRSAIELGLFLFDSSVVVFQDQQKRIIIVVFFSISIY